MKKPGQPGLFICPTENTKAASFDAAFSLAPVRRA
jgi:hypothetical protein